MKFNRMELNAFDPDGVGVDNGTYFGLPFEPGTAELVLVSAPWDVTVSYGAGTAHAPDAVIEASTQLDFHEPLAPGVWRRGIATATIGFDHIDTAWCAAHGIRVATAAGCNARGVLQWAGAVLAHLARTQGWKPAQRTLGIVGVGHVGSLIREYAGLWGFRVVCCDPPREEREHCGFLPLEEVAREADLLTFHTPLDTTTRHMAGEELFARLKPGAVVMNSSRGEVVDGDALLRSGHPCVLDVWEHEPHLDPQLLDRALLATPHVAGYSEQGKATATAMSVATLAGFFGLPLRGWYPSEAAPSVPRPIPWQELCTTIGDAYDIEAESCRLKARPADFEAMRDHYRYRREYF